MAHQFARVGKRESALYAREPIVHSKAEPVRPPPTTVLTHLGPGRGARPCCYDGMTRTGGEQGAQTAPHKRKAGTSLPPNVLPSPQYVLPGDGDDACVTTPDFGSVRWSRKRFRHRSWLSTRNLVHVTELSSPCFSEYHVSTERHRHSVSAAKLAGGRVHRVSHNGLERRIAVPCGARREMGYGPEVLQGFQR